MSECFFFSEHSILHDSAGRQFALDEFFAFPRVLKEVLRIQPYHESADPNFIARATRTLRVVCDVNHRRVAQAKVL